MRPAHSHKRLTSFAPGAGCGCKLPAAELHALLAGLPRTADDAVLVGYQGADDAAVIQITPDLGLVQTVDFFTPVVDDPEDFGAIAAANALSDVYAMGGRPVSAMSIVAFPLEVLGPDMLRGVLNGAIQTLQAAGVPLVGGHSIEDPEPKFGLAVSGLIDPRRVLANSGAQPGDVLVLSKPIGTGAVVTAAQRGEVESAWLTGAVSVMRELNRDAAESALRAGASAATDITGFGLLGHVHGIARESGLAATLDASTVPYVDGADELLGAGAGISGGSRRNAEWAQTFTGYAATVASWRRSLLSDATTSGGLVVAVAPERAHEAMGVPIGRVHAGPAGRIEVQ